MNRSFRIVSAFCCSSIAGPVLAQPVPKILPTMALVDPFTPVVPTPVPTIVVPVGITPSITPPVYGTGPVFVTPVTKTTPRELLRKAKKLHAKALATPRPIASPAPGTKSPSSGKVGSVQKAF